MSTSGEREKDAEGNDLPGPSRRPQLVSDGVPGSGQGQTVLGSVADQAGQETNMALRPGSSTSGPAAANLGPVVGGGPATEPSGIPPAVPSSSTDGTRLPDRVVSVHELERMFSLDPFWNEGASLAETVVSPETGRKKEEKPDEPKIHPIKAMLETLPHRFPFGDVVAKIGCNIKQRDFIHQDSYYAKLAKCFSCQICFQYDDGNMFACTDFGHVICQACFGYPEIDPNQAGHGFCQICQKEGGIRRSYCRGLLAKVSRKCEFQPLGCPAKIIEKHYQQHVMNCKYAFRCFLCKQPVSRFGWFNHVMSAMNEHPPIAFLKPRTNHDGKIWTPLQFDIKIPYMGPFAMFPFEIMGYGQFCLYQLVLSKFKTVWFLVRSSRYGMSKVYAKFRLEATNKRKGSERLFIEEWITGVFPWRTRLMYSLADVLLADPEFKTTFCFDSSELATVYGRSTFRCRLTLNLKEGGLNKCDRTGRILQESDPNIDEEQIQPSPPVFTPFSFNL